MIESEEYECSMSVVSIYCEFSNNRKKEFTLSKKDRISNLNIIGDLTCSPLLR
jgi:hypothetical protein